MPSFVFGFFASRSASPYDFSMTTLPPSTTTIVPLKCPSLVACVKRSSALTASSFGASDAGAGFVTVGVAAGAGSCEGVPPGDEPAHAATERETVERRKERRSTGRARQLPCHVDDLARSCSERAADAENPWARGRRQLADGPCVRTADAAFCNGRAVARPSEARSRGACEVSRGRER